MRGVVIFGSVRFAAGPIRCEKSTWGMISCDAACCDLPPLFLVDVLSVAFRHQDAGLGPFLSASSSRRYPSSLHRMCNAAVSPASTSAIKPRSV